MTKIEDKKTIIVCTDCNTGIPFYSINRKHIAKSSNKLGRRKGSALCRCAFYGNNCNLRNRIGYGSDCKYVECFRSGSNTCFDSSRGPWCYNNCGRYNGAARKKNRSK